MSLVTNDDSVPDSTELAVSVQELRLVPSPTDDEPSVNLKIGINLTKLFPSWDVRATAGQHVLELLNREPGQRNEVEAEITTSARSVKLTGDEKPLDHVDFEADELYLPTKEENTIVVLLSEQAKLVCEIAVEVVRERRQRNNQAGPTANRLIHDSSPSILMDAAWRLEHECKSTDYVIAIYDDVGNPQALLEEHHGCRWLQAWKPRTYVVASYILVVEAIKWAQDLERRRASWVWPSDYVNLDKEDIPYRAACNLYQMRGEESIEVVEDIHNINDAMDACRPYETFLFLPSNVSRNTIVVAPGEIISRELRMAEEIANKTEERKRQLREGFGTSTERAS